MVQAGFDRCFHTPVPHALANALPAAVKTPPSRPMPLPGAPPPDDPDNPTHLPVDPDDGGMPPTLPAEDDEGTDWQPPA